MPANPLPRHATCLPHRECGYGEASAGKIKVLRSALARSRMERAKGIEPSYAAWEAAVLPLNYPRDPRVRTTITWGCDGEKPLQRPCVTRCGDNAVAGRPHRDRIHQSGR